MHRTQIMLTEAQYLRLKEESERLGRSIGDLVRSAVEEVYETSQERLKRALRDSRGAWADRDDIGDGAEYVERIRQPLGERLQGLDWG
jgi:hypothetical protein